MIELTASGRCCLCAHAMITIVIHAQFKLEIHFPIRDGILKAYVEENLEVEEIVRMGYEEATVREVIRMVDANEHKRYQAALGLKISMKAFGRGRRYPIAKGKDA